MHAARMRKPQSLKARCICDNTEGQVMHRRQFQLKKRVSVNAGEAFETINLLCLFVRHVFRPDYPFEVLAIEPSAYGALATPKGNYNGKTWF